MHIAYSSNIQYNNVICLLKKKINLLFGQKTIPRNMLYRLLLIPKLRFNFWLGQLLQYIHSLARPQSADSESSQFKSFHLKYIFVLSFMHIFIVLKCIYYCKLIVFIYLGYLVY